MSELTSLTDQLAAVQHNQHKQAFRKALAMKTGVQVTFDDIELAQALSHDELVIAAIISIAKQRRLTADDPQDDGRLLNYRDRLLDVVSTLLEPHGLEIVLTPNNGFIIKSRKQ